MASAQLNLGPVEVGGWSAQGIPSVNAKCVGVSKFVVVIGFASEYLLELSIGLVGRFGRWGYGLTLALFG